MLSPIYIINHRAPHSHPSIHPSKSSLMSFHMFHIFMFYLYNSNFNSMLYFISIWFQFHFFVYWIFIIMLVSLYVSFYFQFDVYFIPQFEYPAVLTINSIISTLEFQMTKHETLFQFSSMIIF